MRTYKPEFPHLPLIRKVQGLARLEGGGGKDQRVEDNKRDRVSHAAALTLRLRGVAARSVERSAARKQQAQPSIAGGVPFVLQIPNEDDDALAYIADKLGLEVVAEYSDGYLIVSASDLDLAAVMQAAEDFGSAKRGSGAMAKIIGIDDDPLSEARLLRILGDDLYRRWPFYDNDTYVLDVSVESAILGRPARPRVTSRSKPEVRAAREAAYEAALDEHRARWDGKRRARESEIEEFTAHYDGEILSITDDSHVVPFPDSFSMRIRMSGRGFTDLVANYPSLFEVARPDIVQEPARAGDGLGDEPAHFELLPPDRGSPLVCIIDSGIQEEHRWLRNALHTQSSRCFLPGADPANVADLVGGGGHGTRVAGAVLYASVVPHTGQVFAPVFLQNARVLDHVNCLPERAYPPDVLREVVEHYLSGYGTRIYNHSISAGSPCRTTRMSAWATTIDVLSYAYDVLVIQAAGNLATRGRPNAPGIIDHLVENRAYPSYLLLGSSRVANPGQSLQALTVGSVAAVEYHDADRHSVAGAGHASSFSRAGLGLWESIKPDVVEYGGDDVADTGNPPSLTNPPAVCPELVRSTLHGGPAISKDSVGTSFAAPKVTHVVAAVAALFPGETTQLYRALVVNSARWPVWAEQARADQRPAIARTLGYGIPDLDRATGNDPNRVTLVADSEYLIRAGEGLVFGVPIPVGLRSPGEEYDVRVDVTLAYSAEPRRTRRSRRGYLGVWLDWKSSRRGEDFSAFVDRALKQDDDSDSIGGISMPWALGNKRERDGLTGGITRRNGTVQKDWAHLKNHELPDVFGVVVRGHKGWDRRNPSAFARFSLVVSVEALGVDIPVYERISQAVEAEIEQPVLVKVDGTAGH